MVPEEIAPKPDTYSLRPVVMGKGGMVVAGTPLAAQAGARMLARGGTAADAAIAAAAVQAVVMPHMSGFGGDLFLLHAGSDGTVRALNASGPAPASATVEAYRARGFQAVPVRGIEAVSVPGAVHGWFRTLRELGRLRPAEVFEPALGYAQEGFPVHKNFIRYLGSRAFRVLSQTYPVLAQQYLRHGRLPDAGARLVQPELAQTIRRVIQDGPDGFYRGETARLIARSSADLGGFLAEGDLARYESQWVTPIATTYQGLHVFHVPPNSQGVTMLEQLRALELFDLVALGHNSAAYIHLLVEVKRAAFADRDRLVADPDVVRVPVEEFLSVQKAREFQKAFDPQHASGGHTTPKQPGGDTTCLVAVDKEGNAVSLIQSLYEEFGSGVFIEGAGFVLHDRLCGFTLEPGHPNVLAPGKRPLHTLCCSLVTKGNRLVLAFATPGGHSQTQTLVQVLQNFLTYGMDVQEAIEAPRFVHTGAQVLLEKRIPESVRSALEQRGHLVDYLPEWSTLVGGCAAIAIHPEEGTRQGGADPRRDSYAVAV